MICRTFQRKKYAFLEAAVTPEERISLQNHLASCASCRKACEEAETLRKWLRSGAAEVETSPDFDARFWSRVRERESAPWTVRLGRFLEELLPVPQLAPLAALLTAAFLIGSAGGLASFIDLADETGRGVIPMSGFEEYKGMPESSLTGTYLKAIEGAER
ncbi:MAG: zf-HC2 domain-containing protein [Candidatus Omnitrophica bacterium]|nr:zf-HC2 domain-containing protein [Candidatus Omnitrophota bacterium]